MASEKTRDLSSEDLKTEKKPVIQRASEKALKPEGTAISIGSEV